MDNWYGMPPYMMQNFDFMRAGLEYENLKERYPAKVKCLAKYVEREIDKYEYFGSFIYDEYPDKVTVFGIVKRIYDNQLSEGCFGAFESKELMMIIIELLVYNEIFARKRDRVSRYW